MTVAEMRDLERRAFAAGVSERELQENAGQAVAAVAAELAGPPGAATIVAVAGPGNNGRDAMVAARALARHRHRVRLYLAPRHAVTSDELAELADLAVEAQEHGSESDLARLAGWLDGASVAIDGLLGIGVRGAMREPLAAIARTVNAARTARGGWLRVVAVDVPSGIDADTGAAPGEVVRADVTVALGAVKAGTLRFPAAELAGAIRPVPIGLPAGLTADLPVRVLDRAVVEPLVPARPPAAHKGTLGRVLVVGGSRQYVGAPVLAGLAAARSGCGLVGLAVPRHVQTAAAARFPEATYVLLAGEGAETDPTDASEAVAAVLGEFDVALIGPGLGRSPGALALVDRVLRSAGGTRLVVDADALFALTRIGDWWTRAPAGSILTPHHGEMGRLVGIAASDVAAQTWELAHDRAAAWRQVVVLKGPFTVVAEPDGRAWVHPRANPALATAGTGDVLAGLIAGLVAQGAGPTGAARLGVWAHAETAAIVQERRAFRSLIAGDLIDEIPLVLGRLARGDDQASPRRARS